MIGIWAARHYPLIGKKLNGVTWEPPKKYNVQMTESVEIEEQESHNIVSKKMKLRIIEVNVCKCTSKKLKYFVPAPMDIGRDNVTLISSKIRAFDIESEYMAGCWQALMLGAFPSDFEVIVEIVFNTRHEDFSSIILIFTATNEFDYNIQVRRNYGKQNIFGNFRIVRLKYSEQQMPQENELIRFNHGSVHGFC